MTLRRILVLLVLVAALGAYLFLYEVPQAEREAAKEKLLGVDKDAIAGITLGYPDREIVLEKRDGVWRLTKPVDAPADDNAVKGIVNTLADAEVQKTLDELPADLAPFGLDKPTVTAQVRLKDGSQPPSVAVGKNTAIGGKAYVRKGDEKKLYLTASSIGFGLNKQPKDLRDKTLITFQDDAVTRVDIVDGPKTTTLVRKEKDAWTVEPGTQPADPTEVRSYLSSLRATRAADFPDDAPADLGKYGLTSPRLTVTVTTKKDDAETTHKLLLGSDAADAAQKQVYAKCDDRPNVYAIGDWSVRSLGKAPEQFRDKTVLAFEPGRVGKLVLTRKAGEPVTLTRAEAGGWTLEGADGKTLKADAISRYLDDLRDLRGADIAAEPPGNLARFGLDAPDLRISLTDKQGQDLGTVIAARRDDKYYTMRGGGPTVFEARDYMYTRLDKQRTSFVESGTTSTTLAGPDENAAVDDVGDDGEEFALPDEED